MTNDLRAAAPDAHAAAAEEVRAWLVQVRGGAPFLSSADGRLLLEWIEGGVAVAAILAAIDRAAERRRARRVRTRLTLVACKGALKAVPLRALEGSSPGLADLAARIAEMEVPPLLEEARAALSDALRAIEVEGTDAVATAAIAACRRFHEAAWEAAAAEHPALAAAARADLSTLEGAVSAALFEDLVAEVARDHLRRRFPLVSAREVWDTLNGPPTGDSG